MEQVKKASKDGGLRTLLGRSLIHDFVNDLFGARCAGWTYENSLIAVRYGDHTAYANFAQAIFERLSLLLVSAKPDFRSGVLRTEFDG